MVRVGESEAFGCIQGVRDLPSFQPGEKMEVQRLSRLLREVGRGGEVRHRQQGAKPSSAHLLLHSSPGFFTWHLPRLRRVHWSPCPLGRGRLNAARGPGSSQGPLGGLSHWWLRGGA